MTGTAGTIWTTTAALCLLLACGACSGHKYLVRRDPLPVPSIPQAAAPPPETIAPERTGPAEWNDLTAAMPGRPRRRLADRVTSRRPRLWSTCQETRCKLWTDLDNYCCWDVTADFLLGIAATSVLANTSLDQDFRDWYQDDVRSEGTDHWADFWKTFGDGKIFIPAYAGLAVVGGMCDETLCGSAVGEFGCRTTRAYVIGSPTLLFFQYCLGGARPGESEHESRWRPFEESHGASGHAFVGAVPFITAAKMTDDPCLKSALYACSILPAWSRIDHDQHYLSQAWLGWWMAYLACRAVDDTEQQYENLTLTPIVTPEMVGVGALYEW